MDKEGIMGILNGLNAFLKSKKEQDFTSFNKTEKEQTESKPPVNKGDGINAEVNTVNSDYTKIPEQMSYSPELLRAIERHETHIKNIGRKLPADK